MTNRNYIAKRPKFLIIVGLGAIPLGLHLSTAPSQSFSESLEWMPGAFDANEVGLIWIFAGLLAMIAGIVNYSASTKSAEKSYLEAAGFTGIFLASFMLVVIEAVAWIVFDVNALAVIAWGVTISLLSLNAATWDNPRTLRRQRELTPTQILEIPKEVTDYGKSNTVL